MTKLKLKTFGDLSKKLKVQEGSSKEVIIKADCALFAQMIIIAENRKLKISDVLCHPLEPLPSALALAEGSQEKPTRHRLPRAIKESNCSRCNSAAMCGRYRWNGNGSEA